MHFKFLTSIALLALLVGVALAWRSATINSQSREPATIRVVIDQLPAKDGVIPVEIIQATAVSSAPNIVDDVSYVLKNNSGKAISAVAVAKEILYREGGKLLGASFYSMVDFSFHPDMVGSEAFAAANAQVPMEASGPKTFDEGIVIQSVKLKIEYVQYVGASSYGSGTEGEHRIMSQREGAKKYKELLRKKYSQAGKSLVTVVPLLENINLQELKLEENESAGADRYRRYLLKTFRTKGAAEIERYIKPKE